MTYVGSAVSRVDGRDKVMGRATYSAEWAFPDLAHAALVTSPVGPGRLVTLDTRAAERAPGVLAVLTHHNARPFGLATVTSAIERVAARSMVPPDASLALKDDRIRHAGQPVAVVIAESPEQARAAAALVVMRIDADPAHVALGDRLQDAYDPKTHYGEPVDVARGDVAQGLASADVTLDLTYETAAESHNPMEPHATIARVENGVLTLYDATQYVHGVKLLMALQLGRLPGKVRVVSRFVGGAFGSKGIPWPHVPLAAIAALHVGRPVKLVLTRRQMFGQTGFRPATIQRVRLGATREGRLTALAHDGTSQTSRDDAYTEAVGRLAQMLYSCPNVAVTHRLVPLDTQSATFQRAPGEAPGSFALECALDELAEALRMDPLALRLANYAEHDEDKERPWSSKALRECYREGAERFGWADRPAPRTRRGGQLVGWGMATASYPTNRAGATARVVLDADGRALVQTASHDLGTGTYTILTQVAADALGLPLERVRTELGDTDYPYAPVAGGSQSAASCSVPVHEAATAVRDALVALAIAHRDSPLHGVAPHALGWAEGRLFVRDDPGRAESYPVILARAGKATLEAERETKPGDEGEKFGSHAWGAQFAEVAVDPDFGTVRVVRMVGAFAAGRILNLKTARSQLLGGMVMGVGMALHEEVVRDGRQGRVVNGSLADYLVPVHADIKDLDVLLVAEADAHVNPLGIKGVGELGIVGAAAAIANAVAHATGKRPRALPIRPEHLL